jgi:hypothetical protein
MRSPVINDEKIPGNIIANFRPCAHMVKPTIMAVISAYINKKRLVNYPKIQYFRLFIINITYVRNEIRIIHQTCSKFTKFIYSILSMALL